LKNKYIKQVFVHDKVSVALNDDKDKYLNFETSTSSNTVRNVCVRCHDSQKLNSFGVSKEFKCYYSEYERVTFPEMIVLKDNARIKILVDDEG
jgi:hypothetical protein